MARWTHMAKRTFAYTAFELMSDLSGNLVGYLKVRGVYTVSASGNGTPERPPPRYSIADGHVLYSVEVTEHRAADPRRTALESSRFVQFVPAAASTSAFVRGRSGFGGWAGIHVL